MSERSGLLVGSVWGAGSGDDHSCDAAAHGPVQSGQDRAPEGRFKYLSSGHFHNCAVREDGTLACWGAGQVNALLGYDKKLCSEVLHAFTTEVQRSLRRRAKHALGLDSVELAHTAGVTFIQRFDSALRLNVHFHSLFLDGVYVGRDRARDHD